MTVRPRRFLVTGGTGFLGGALVRRLLAEGHAVRVLDNELRSSRHRLGDVVGDVELVIGDVRDEVTVGRAVAGSDCVLHLAAVNGTENFYSHPELVLDVGVRGMLCVLDACRRHNVVDLVVASSSEVYQTPPEIPTDESAPLVVPDPMNPRYSYGSSKIISELLAVNWAHQDFERVAIFRPHNVYGPDMGWEHVLPQFIVRAMTLAREQPEGMLRFPIQGDGSETRAFTYIDDLVDGVMIVVDEGEHRGIYHVGNPEELAIADVARRVVASIGREMELVPGKIQAGSTLRRCPDVRKLAALGFTPRVSFDEGLRPTVEWYAANVDRRPG